MQMNKFQGQGKAQSAPLDTNGQIIQPRARSAPLDINGTSIGQIFIKLQQETFIFYKDKNLAQTSCIMASLY